MNNNNEYDGLMDTGYLPPKEVSPEEEFFHSIYISGISRKNHIGIVENIGKIQIRGIQYNLDEVYFIITHVKPVLVKKEKINDKERITCFSYQNTKPCKGKDGRICPSNREDRDSIPSCKGCRGEIILAGILCEKIGKPIIIDGKPVFVFIRGKGIKSPNIYSYLEKITKMEIEPPIFPDNPTLEKMVAKNKRHVTKVTTSTSDSKHGIKNVFMLDIGQRLDDAYVREVLKIQKKTLPQFNEKFDWSNNIQSQNFNDDSNITNSSSEYVPESSSSNTTKNDNPKVQDQNKDEKFSFDDLIKF
jgi:hypothetical protein